MLLVNHGYTDELGRRKVTNIKSNERDLIVGFEVETSNKRQIICILLWFISIDVLFREVYAQKSVYKPDAYD